MLSGKKILIIEEEFLIALDIQRILEGAGTAKTVFARSAQEAGALEGNWSEFDLVLMEMRHDNGSDYALAETIIDQGIRLAFTSSDVGYRREAFALMDVPVVLKPFDENALLAACNAALAPRLV